MIFLSITNAEEETTRPVGICAMKGCNCTVKAHRWVFVKCVFSDDQVKKSSSFSSFVANKKKRVFSFDEIYMAQRRQ